MKITTNENGDQIQRSIELHMANILGCSYEEMFTKSGENESYFMIYFNDSNELEVPIWFKVIIPFDYENRSGKVVPIYEEKIISYELYIDEELATCELSDDEQLILASMCVKALLEDFVYSCVEYKEVVL